MRAFQRNDTVLTRALAIITIILVVCLAVLLVIPLMLGEYLDLPEIYWRVVVAVAILAAVGTALVPLINTLLTPKGPRAPVARYGAPPTPPQHLAAEPAAPAQELLPWPTYVDARTPLPMLPDGSPDWNAYYTGYPSPGAHVFTEPKTGGAAALGTGRAARVRTSGRADGPGIPGLPAASSAAATPVAVLRSGPASAIQQLQRGHRGVVSADSADGTTPARAGSAQQHALVRGRHSPPL